MLPLHHKGMAPAFGIEPKTRGFGDPCSTTELHRLVETVERLELSTTRFGSERSILLSYTAMICWRCQRCRRAIMWSS